jgi:quinol monooxygenase YgiN
MSYRGYTSVWFRAGAEPQILKYIEEEVLRPAMEQFGAHDVELLADERNPGHFVLVAVWNSSKDASHFHHQVWNKHASKIQAYCTKPAEHAMFKTRNKYTSKARKAA